MELHGPGGVKRKILICDDEQDILAVTRFVLEENGFTVVTVDNSLLVIEQIKNEGPDLVLVDLSMPGMSGDEVVSQLKKQEQLNYIPVIVFSASVDGRMVAFQSGANDFLAKPFDIENLLQLIKKHIRSA